MSENINQMTNSELHARAEELRFYLEYPHPKVNRETAVQQLEEITELLIERLEIGNDDD